MILSIPYSYINGVSVGDCGVEYLTINIENNDLCGEKFFTLQIQSLPVIDGVQATNFLYNGNAINITIWYG